MTLALSLLLRERAGQAAEVDGAAAAPSGVRGFSLALMGGTAIPRCSGQQLCEGLQSPAPTLEILALWRVTPPLDAGLVAQVSRVAWEVPVQLAAFGPPSKLRSTLTTGFVGIGVRSTLREARVSLFGTLALGSAFQVETGSNIATAEAWTGMSNLSCNAGFNPTAQVGLGVSSRASRHMSVFAIATGTIGWKWKDCIPTNQNEGGLPHIPLGAWGPALQAGAAFDIGP